MLYCTIEANRRNIEKAIKRWHPWVDTDFICNTQERGTISPVRKKKTKRKKPKYLHGVIKNCIPRIQTIKLKTQTPLACSFYFQHPFPPPLLPLSCPKKIFYYTKNLIKHLMKTHLDLLTNAQKSLESCRAQANSKYPHAQAFCKSFSSIYGICAQSPTGLRNDFAKIW